MLSRFRSNLTSAHVLAGAALFISLGGTSYAVGKDTIGSKQIKNGSIQSADIGNGKVTSKDIRNQTLTTKDIANGKIGGTDIKNGTLTPAKFKAGSIPAGAKGAKGDTGPAGATHVRSVSSSQMVCNIDGCLTSTAIATCGAGEHAVGGGAYSVSDDAIVQSYPNGPAAGPNQWWAQTKDPTGGDTGANVTALVLCASP